MSDVVAELATRAKISDPKPARCAACFCGSDANLRFVDFSAAINRGAVVDKTSMAVIDSIDELHLCENCMREGAEQLGLKPELHSRQLREIHRLEAVVEFLNSRLVTERGQREEIEQRMSRLAGLTDEPPKRGRRAA